MFGFLLLLLLFLLLLFGGLSVCLFVLFCFNPRQMRFWKEYCIWLCLRMSHAYYNVLSYRFSLFLY